MEKKETKQDKDIKAGRHTVSLTNLQKVYWPDEGYTKGDLIQYYQEVADSLLPYLKDRPQSLHRYPDGIKGGHFYQKDLDTDNIPDWVKYQTYVAESTQKEVDFLVCNDLATLLYAVNLGCIELNPWNSRITNPDHPDWLVMDLDPEDIAFKEVVQAALTTKDVLDELELPAHCKTSGATGIHIYVPLDGKAEYEAVRNFAKKIAEQVHERLPATTSITRSPDKRQKRVYLDFLQNSRGQTLAAPYCVRPKPGATVSTPLEWSELTPKLDPKDFTIKNILQRLSKKGDLWKPVLSKGIRLPDA